jgi:hypothetical protein
VKGQKPSVAPPISPHHLQTVAVADDGIGRGPVLPEVVQQRRRLRLIRRLKAGGHDFGGGSTEPIQDR